MEMIFYFKKQKKVKRHFVVVGIFGVPKIRGPDNSDAILLFAMLF